MEEEIKELIAAACGTREALDSLGLIELLEGLEDLGIEIQSTQTPRDAFRTVEGILALCRRC